MTFTTRPRSSPSFFFFLYASFCPRDSLSLLIHRSHLFVTFFISHSNTSTHRAHPRTGSHTPHSVLISKDFRIWIEKSLVWSSPCLRWNYIEISLRKVLLLPYITFCSDESIGWKRVKKLYMDKNEGGVGRVVRGGGDREGVWAR